jgi:CelD/BcsL family acetyltransferase involved in cellulose biosynthesis
VIELEAAGRADAAGRRAGGSIPLLGPEAAAHSAGELTTDIVTDIEGIGALEPDYECLYRLSGNTLPFALQEWHLAWCRHFLNRNPRVHDQPLFCVSRDGAGACVGIVPLILTRRHLGLLKVDTLALVGGDPALTEIRGPLIRPGYERRVVEAVYQRMATVRDWHWIQWSGISTALAQSMTGEIAPQWFQVSEAFILDLPASWEELRAGMGRNLRESLRHCYNSLRRDGYGFEFVVARTRAEVREALARFLELHARRAAMSWGARHPNRFAGRSLQEFLYDVCDCLAARDAVRVFQLRIRGKIVATRVAFIVGDGMYLYYSGFDPAWARYSVMTTTMAEAIRYAIASGLRTVNLSLTAEQSKLRWRPRLVEYHSGLLVHRRSVSSRLVYGAYRIASSGHGAPARLLKSVLRRRRDWS